MFQCLHAWVKKEQDEHVSRSAARMLSWFDVSGLIRKERLRLSGNEASGQGAEQLPKSGGKVDPLFRFGVHNGDTSMTVSMSITVFAGWRQTFLNR